MKTITQRFCSSININEHPLDNCNIKLQSKYYSLLELFAYKVYANDFTSETLDEYKKHFKIQFVPENNKNEIMSYFLKPWRKKYFLLLVYDLCLINCPFNVSRSSLKDAIRSRAIEVCTNRQYKAFCRFLERIFNMKQNDRLINYGDTLRQQVEYNRKFFNNNCKRIIFTANMSAGKSTIINAIIGKKIAKTAQEVCTGNISYIYNKSFEDGHIHLIGDRSTINTDTDELLFNNCDKERYISSYFNLADSDKSKLCLIDTPGVNSSMNRQHGRITRSALDKREYDIIIHVLNAQQLGTDEEIEHLKWIHRNIPDRKIIFILNKLDEFNFEEDDICESINGAKDDLYKIGFEDPLICPISAFFAFLIKQKAAGIKLSEYNQRKYEFYVKKFTYPEYDLSIYYENSNVESYDNEATMLLKKCGFYGFEKIISGGIK